MNTNPCRRARLRWMTLAMIATSVCNACSQPPAPTPRADPGRADVAPASEAPIAPPVAAAPDASAGPPAPPPQPQTPPPAASKPTSPKPLVLPPAATHTPDRPLPAPPAADAAQPVSIVVTTLSRGKGVPTQTRDIYKQIRALLEQQQAQANLTAMQVIRLGLEGETRMCAEFRDARDARPILARIRKLAAGVDLLDVAEAPCPTRKEPQP